MWSCTCMYFSRGSTWYILWLNISILILFYFAENVHCNMLWILCRKNQFQNFRVIRKRRPSQQTSHGWKRKQPFLENARHCRQDACVEKTYVLFFLSHYMSLRPILTHYKFVTNQQIFSAINNILLQSLSSYNSWTITSNNLSSYDSWTKSKTSGFPVIFPGGRKEALWL